MENKPERNNLIERRQYFDDSEFESDNNWKKLTLAQRFAALSLTKYGYELRFTRFTSSGSTAVLVLKNGTPATISEDGDINTTPDINIR
ncbi:hypothetical protein A3Q34_12215 [Colwellia sp. PAMC 20917]|jgi:hypothetical protein|uniref:hypothetical protein n=1 Tax=unclassified Colwellia TaxID=196834 RepID=UPI000878A1C6|nr:MULTISPECIES: hypothetical protein [unclassified Colwellia]MBA6362716.1 hypothetical protein [Colwellia sp. BRX8-8]AOW77550.1 hypothetical protein A3Q34_12215 [Colwellia sp. PAMC 20917]MBA6338760.1 hypothetical protein [Colwellia sp. BRX8-7]MBA6349603.1 hypothetical protein [Colwellia sp. BRX8-9]MBA6353801.1 hypothetical protein [Colwellia sp. BRX9-1]